MLFFFSLRLGVCAGELAGSWGFYWELMLSCWMVLLVWWALLDTGVGSCLLGVEDGKVEWLEVNSSRIKVQIGDLMGIASVYININMYRISNISLFIAYIYCSHDPS